jgi:hypothetical protein
MREELRGPNGEPSIEAAFVATSMPGYRTDLEGGGHAVLTVPRVVHITHRDWIERRASLGYEELPGPTPGVCRYCHCTERRACPGGCAWLYPERTVCSNPECEEKWVQDNLLRTAERAKGAV